MKRAEPSKRRPKPQRQRPPNPRPGELNQATGDEFEREGMGIAPKE